MHYVTGQGANIAEIQMYDHDEERVFAMLLRLELPADRYHGIAGRDGRDRTNDGPFDSQSGLPTNEPAIRAWRFAPRCALSRRSAAIARCCATGGSAPRRTLMIGNRPQLPLGG